MLRFINNILLIILILIDFFEIIDHRFFVKNVIRFNQEIFLNFYRLGR